MNMNNPIFSFLDEGFRLDHICESMGFDYQVFWATDIWEDNDPDTKRYHDDPGKFLDDWTIALPDGWHYAMKHDTEDGPVAVIVKPKTEYAKLLIEFGEQQHVIDANERDKKKSWDAYMERSRQKIVDKRKALNNE